IFSILENALKRAASQDKHPRTPCIPSILDKKVVANLRQSSDYYNYVRAHPINEVEMVMNNDSTIVQEQLSKLYTLDIKELKKLWSEKTGVEAPLHTKRQTLIERLAYLFQERIFGGLSDDDKKQLENAKKRVEKGEPLFERPKYDELTPGMILTREHNGRKHSAKILEKGKVEYNCKIYNSLSAVAREITGARWNGREFFHLIRR
ncbi:MAG: DUF2924 domain-containing protein, partial [Holosporales bacterium]|nr:DUF2924 domain-containing protein [Holosporales bacterium]